MVQRADTALVVDSGHSIGIVPAKQPVGVYKIKYTGLGNTDFDKLGGGGVISAENLVTADRESGVQRVGLPLYFHAQAVENSGADVNLPQ
jgi:hypothetical protein